MAGEERVRATPSIPVEVTCAAVDLASARHAFTAGEWTGVVSHLHSAVTYLVESLEQAAWPPAPVSIPRDGTQPNSMLPAPVAEARLLHREIDLALSWGTVRSCDARRFLLRTEQLATTVGLPESPV